MADSSILKFKILVVGDAKVGKTSYIKNLLGKEFSTDYISTNSVNISTLKYDTTCGEIHYNIWDIGGNTSILLRDGYYLDAHAAIVMFDVTNEESYISSKIWYNEIIRNCGNIPIFICGNKSDKQGTFIIDFDHYRRKNIKYYNISAKSNKYYVNPFIPLMYELVNNPHLQLIRNDSKLDYRNDKENIKEQDGNDSKNDNKKDKETLTENTDFNRNIQDEIVLQRNTIKLLTKQLKILRCKMCVAEANVMNVRNEIKYVGSLLKNARIYLNKIENIKE